MNFFGNFQTLQEGFWFPTSARLPKLSASSGDLKHQQWPQTASLTLRMQNGRETSKNQFAVLEQMQTGRLPMIKKGRKQTKQRSKTKHKQSTKKTKQTNQTNKRGWGDQLLSSWCRKKTCTRRFRAWEGHNSQCWTTVSAGHGIQ